MANASRKKQAAQAAALVPASAARRVAVQVLREIKQRKGHSNRILAEHLEKHATMDPRDRGLVTALVYGVLRHQFRLDYLIDSVADKPQRIRGELREVLRVLTFEQVELERPLRVTSSQGISLAKSLNKDGRLSKLVHSVLSRLDREIEELEPSSGAAPKNNQKRSALETLEQRWSVPRWLGGRWLKTLGAETALERAKSMAKTPSIDLRIDLHRIGRDEAIERVKAELPSATIDVPEAYPQCIRVRAGGDLFYAPLHTEGLVSVQALGSQQAVAILDPKPGERILDTCCGLGVKTRQIAENMQRKGMLVAVDRETSRLEELEQSRNRPGLHGPELDLRIHHLDFTKSEGRASTLNSVPGEPTTPSTEDLESQQESSFDGVLVDAPCTGLGNLGRHPELRSRSRYEDIAECSTLQKEILLAALKQVAPGGRLVYAVCSLEPEEGPQLVANILSELDQNHGFTLEYQQSWTPEEHDADGFYLARLRRT